MDRPGPADRAADHGLSEDSGRAARRRRTRALRLAGALVAGLALGVSIDVLRVGGLDPWLAARGPAVLATPPPYEARGRIVDVSGRDVYLDCRGSGSPTVLLEAGMGSGAAGWGPVFDGIAGLTRVCAWDRPGIGRSEARGRHSAAEAEADLTAALAAAAEHGPYVVVAHSLGGVYARVLAEGPGASERDPGERVVALLLIDTYDPDLGLDADPALPADMRAGIRDTAGATATMIESVEQLDWAATLAELAVAGPVDVVAIALRVDPQARYVDPDPARRELLIEAWERHATALCPACRLEIVPGASHFIHLDRPDLVVERVRELLAAVSG